MGLSRAQPREWSLANLRNGRGLRRLRAGSAGSAGTDGDATLELLPDGKPLAHGRLASRGRRTVAFRGMAYADAYTALARSPPFRGIGSLVPGTIQILSGPGGRPFSHGVPIRRTQRTARQSGSAGRTVALEQSVSVVLRNVRRSEDSVAMARSADARLDRVRQ